MEVEDRRTATACWRPGTTHPTRRAIVDFVDRVVQEGSPQYLPPAERIAVFDNDGTLWCEKPMPIELGFILQRLAEMAEQDPSLRARQPWQAAREQDYAWLGDVITKHYRRRRQRREGADGRHPAGVRRDDGRGLRGAGRAVPRRGTPPDARPAAPRLRLPPDGRAAALPGGQRVHDLHRVRRRPGLHATGHRARSTASRPSASSAAPPGSATRRTTPEDRSSTRPRWTSSTTVP